MGHWTRRSLVRTAMVFSAAMVLCPSGLPLAQSQQVPLHQPSPVRSKAEDNSFKFKAYGVFRDMIVQRNYAPVVQLKNAIDASTTDAVGALSGLRGEISMIEGRLIVSYGAECITECPSAIDESATLLATATAPRWRSIRVDKDMDGLATEAFIREQAKANGLDENKPFPFRFSGALINFTMHINAAPNPRFQGHGSFDEMALTGLSKGPRIAGFVVGFYAPPALQGVITHMGSFFHSHYVDEQRKLTAHLDAFGIAAGSTLLLPQPQ